ncbi:uncharacterized protein [Typha latifolia]|uniref:uncharacterized protein n=1 Tax=Typha latifolia TaxID=4733 RepID=UPI003C2FFAA0
MESNRSSGRIRERLARIFRSSCKPSTSADAALSSGNTSSRALLNYIAQEPVFVPHRRHGDNHPSQHDHQALNFAPVSIVCGGCRPHGDVPPPSVAKSIKGKDGNKKMKERRVRENGGLYETGKAEGRICPPVSPSSPSKNSHYYYYCFNGIDQVVEKKKKKKSEKGIKKDSKKKFLTNSYGFTSSSSIESDDDEDDGYGLFSSEGEVKEEETETFFSSRSFSSDSSEFYQRPIPSSKKKKKMNNNNNNNNDNKKEKEKEKRKRKSHNQRVSSCNKCDVRDGFLPLVSITAEKAKKGFAVVKRSKDPYADFRQSMVEMIVERQIYGAEDLERLLHSYLSLNSPRHHPIILQAFSDIWVVLFGN